jgi:hypothetical protein
LFSAAAAALGQGRGEDDRRLGGALGHDAGPALDGEEALGGVVPVDHRARRDGQGVAVAGALGVADEHAARQQVGRAGLGREAQIAGVDARERGQAVDAVAAAAAFPAAVTRAAITRAAVTGRAAVALVDLFLADTGADDHRENTEDEF